MAGPVCGLMLADMGADVIKVERVPRGDDTRHTLPPDVDGESAAFLMMNRNKRGIAVDLKTEDGKNIARRLLADAHVTIENYRKGTMERLGLGYEEVRKFNPGIIYAELSGFGRTGPYANRAGFDLINCARIIEILPVERTVSVHYVVCQYRIREAEPVGRYTAKRRQ